MKSSHLTEQELYQAGTELMWDLNVDFGPISIRPDVTDFPFIFGNVLVDLPPQVFKLLSQMKNLFFIFTPMPGAEVKQFKLYEDIKAGQILQIVNFPFDIIQRPGNATRGAIVHEIAHVCLGHTSYLDQGGPDPYRAREEAANDLAKEWGFQEEIEALIKYHTVSEPEASA